MTTRSTADRDLLRLLGRRGGLLTAGEAASRTGCPLVEVESALLRLAVAGGADLRVGDDGTVAYRFGPHLRRRLLARSWRLRLEAAGQWLWRRIFGLIRLSFGLVLVALVSVISLLVLVIALIQILGSDDGPEVVFQLLLAALELLARLLVLLISDGFSDAGWNSVRRGKPGEQAHPSEAQARTGEKRFAFFEAVYSLLFGDGDPNHALERRRWVRIGCFLQHRGGAVIAEDLAPLLDLPLRPRQPERAAETADAAMLEVLQRFDGRPAVTPEGDLAYHFPSLQVRASQRGSLPELASLRPAPPLRERVIPFSRTTRQQRQIYGALCAALLVLSPLMLAMIHPAPAALVGLALFAMTYALLLIAVPLVRLQVVRQRNHHITVRNDRRRSWIRGGPGLSERLQRKRRFGQALALQRGLSSDMELAYTTESDLLSQQIAGAGAADLQPTPDSGPC